MSGVPADISLLAGLGSRNVECRNVNACQCGEIIGKHPDRREVQKTCLLSRLAMRLALMVRSCGNYCDRRIRHIAIAEGLDPLDDRSTAKLMGPP